jgi:hypothetical protein
MGLCLVSCAGPKPTLSAASRPKTVAEANPWPAEALKSSKTATAKARPEAPTAKSKPEAPIAKSKPEPKRDAKTSSSEFDDEDSSQDFAGIDTSAPVDAESDDGPREIVIEGIKGTSSEFDVRTTLDNRYEDFDRCHDRVGGGGGRISYRIHILATGDVGSVKVRTSRARNRKLVDCYTEVVSSSHFPHPHGGYADVKWTTKVGRS